MNIVCYTNKLNDGGAERVLSVLANGLARRGHDITVVVGYETPNEYPLDARIHRVALDLGGIAKTRRGGIKRTWKRICVLRDTCRKKNADVLISFLADANFRAIAATRFLKTKNLISVRNDPHVAYGKKTTALLAGLLHPLAEGCVFQTEQAKNWFPARLQKNSQVIYNCIADEFYHVTPAPMTEKRIVACGRLAEQKRFDLLIDAFDRICDDFPDYTLEIYGDGYLRKTLQKQIEQLGRQERIRLMGRSNDVPNTIKNASLFVLSSDYEGLPNALMEAMALCLPVVSTDCGGGGARTLIDHENNGLLVPCGDANALADAIKKSLSDPSAAKQRGEKAAQKAKMFTTENVVTQWEAYIKRITKER